MVIIIEGADGSGKSSLARTLHRQTNWLLIHRSQPKDKQDKQRMMDEYLDLIWKGEDVIFDRSWYSEMVYGPIMRDESVISYEQMHTLEIALTLHGALIIYCEDDLDILWERCQERGEDYVTSKETLKQVCDGYERLFKKTTHYIPIVTYNWRKYG